ncbi:MAG: hypothetical protein BAJALOKI3v1_250006 [Promethearchaeota archaeon]|nr:MAG: hypothetical protein BAJALOKI3v1_250006 [Candidatus Lokiarchaeota archaeon]
MQNKYKHWIEGYKKGAPEKLGSDVVDAELIALKMVNYINI